MMSLAKHIASIHDFERLDRAADVSFCRGFYRIPYSHIRYPDVGVANADVSSVMQGDHASDVNLV